VRTFEPGESAALREIWEGRIWSARPVTVVEDAVATLWPEIQRATLDIIGRAYARVLPAKAVADEIASW